MYFRNIGILVGCLVGGHVTHRVNQHVLLGVDLLVIGSCYVVVTWFRSLTYLCVTFGIQSFFAGFHVLGTYIRSLNMLPCKVLQPREGGGGGGQPITCLQNFGHWILIFFLFSL